jgi:signal transduction histidine kinase
MGSRATWFLPAGRTPAERLEAQAAKLAGNPLVDALFQAAGGAVAVLNEDRIIVAINQPYLDLLGEGSAEAMGLRPGEAIECTRVAEGPDGCGTGAGCASCGAALSILVSEHRRRRTEERDCTITVRRGDRRLDLDLRVRAMPIEVEGERFTLLAVTDVSAERRRQQLERSFDGDLQRQLAALRGAAGVLSEASPSPDGLGRLRRAIQGLDRSFQVQRALSLGVAGRVEPVARTVSIADELTVLADTVERSEAARGRKFEIAAPPAAEVMVVDSAMLQHVLTAMALNALEATRPAGRARLDVELSQATVTFRVWNAGAIPAVVTHRVFQRYFTTRGAGRGSGTWSMKIVGEEFLGGQVGFRSAEPGGTLFWITLPRRPFARA